MPETKKRKKRQQLENEEREKRKKERESEVHDVASVKIPQLRKELNALVSITAGRTGRPHGAIHTEVRKKCGGPPTAMCSAEQLQARIDYLRRW